MKRTIAILAPLFLLALAGFASAEFFDNGDGTIIDNNTGMVWQKAFVKGDHDASNRYCEQSDTGGYYDWRIPTLAELQVIIDPTRNDPSIYPEFSCASEKFWSCTLSSNGNSFWVINFANGENSKGSGKYVRCIRNGKFVSDCATLESNLDISIPCLDYNGAQFILKLKYYTDSSLPEGFYWELDSIQEK